MNPSSSQSSRDSDKVTKHLGKSYTVLLQGSQRDIKALSKALDYHWMTQEKEDSVTSRQKKMADKNFLKNKWKMVGNELKNRIYRRTRKK